MTEQADAPELGDAGTRVFECFDCGQFHRLPELAPRAEARCRRCHSLLQRRRADPLRRTLAWCVAALAAFAIAALLPFMEIDLYGRSHSIVLGSGPRELNHNGMWELAVLVGTFTIAMPGIRVGGLSLVLLGVQARRPPPYLHVLLRWLGKLRVWSMLEVYLLGAFVAYTKLLDLAHVAVLTAGYALGAFMLLQAAMEASFDAEVAWQKLESFSLVHDPDEVRATLAELARHDQTEGLIGCEHCGFVGRGGHGAACARCGGRVHVRKPQALGRCWALLVAATILYIPANMFPILTALELGKGEPSTIIGGVEQLAKAEMYPLAILVFFASITVPAVKLVGMIIVLVSTQRHSRYRLRDRTTLFRIVEAIGRWSMIDVFMLSILVALVQLGFVATVTPGYGAIAFAGVVVLTMLAAMAFDPRLMWDAALTRPRLGGKERKYRGAAPHSFHLGPRWGEPPQTPIRLRATRRCNATSLADECGFGGAPPNGGPGGEVSWPSFPPPRWSGP